MLLHLTPRLFSQFADIKLIDVSIEPFGLHLRSGRELAVRKPYRNKRYCVACRRKGNTAIDGIYIETPGPVGAFEYTARWDVAGVFEATHKVSYTIIDGDFDAADESCFLWYQHSKKMGEAGDWSSRWPGGRSDDSPLADQGKIAMIATESDRALLTKPDHCSFRHEPQHASFGDVGIAEYCQDYRMPTIERERLLVSWIGERYPRLEDAFRV